MKKWCIWCETGSMPKDGYVWIHEECFENMHSIGSDIETVAEYMRGEMPCIAANGNKLGRDAVEDFLVAMADFDRRSRNVMKLIKSVRHGTPLEPLEQIVLPSSTSKEEEPKKLNLNEVKAEKKRIGVEEKGRVPDPWNYFGLWMLSNRVKEEADELVEAVKAADDETNTFGERDAVIGELADVANFVDFVEKRLIKLGWLESSELEGKS